MSNPMMPIKININLNIDNSKPRFRSVRNQDANRDDLFVGRKIENAKVEFLNNSDLSSIKKFPIPVEIVKPCQRNLNKSHDNNNNNPNLLINETIQEITPYQAITFKKRAVNLNNSMNNQTQSFIGKKSIINNNNNNTSFQQHQNKPLKKSKKQQLEDLLQQLQKLTPEIHDLLRKKERKASKSRSPPQKHSLSPKSSKPKKKKNKGKKTKKNEKSMVEYEKNEKLMENTLEEQKKCKKQEKSIDNKKKLNVSMISKENLKVFMNEKIDKSFKSESNDNSKLMKIINEKKKKFDAKKQQEKQKELELEQKKMEKMQELIKKNEEIRRKNQIRFLSIPKRKKAEKKPQKEKKIKKKINENQRREELGLSWLNEVDETKYQAILERNRSKSQEKSRDISQNIEKKRKNSQEKGDLKNFILSKKKEYQENIKKSRNMKEENAFRTAQNLKILNEAIEINRNSCKNTKTSYINSSSFEKKSFVGSPPFQATPVEKNFPKNLANLQESSIKKSIKSPKQEKSPKQVKAFKKCEEYFDAPHNMLTASFPNQISRIPTENEHLDERIEIDELDKSSSFSDRNLILSNEKKQSKIQENSKEMEEENFNNAANLIQRIWRGYKTRALVEEYLKFMLVGRNEEQYLEYYPEDLEAEHITNDQEIQDPEDLEAEDQIHPPQDPLIFDEESKINQDEQILSYPGSNSHKITSHEPLSLQKKMVSNSLNGEEMIIYKDSTEKEDLDDELLNEEDFCHQGFILGQKAEDFQREMKQIRGNELKNLIGEVRRSLEKKEEMHREEEQQHLMEELKMKDLEEIKELQKIEQKMKLIEKQQQTIKEPPQRIEQKNKFGRQQQTDLQDIRKEFKEIDRRIQGMEMRKDVQNMENPRISKEIGKNSQQMNNNRKDNFYDINQNMENPRISKEIGKNSQQMNNNRKDNFYDINDSQDTEKRKDYSSDKMRNDFPGKDSYGTEKRKDHLQVQKKKDFNDMYRKKDYLEIEIPQDPPSNEYQKKDTINNKKDSKQIEIKKEFLGKFIEDKKNIMTEDEKNNEELYDNENFYGESNNDGFTSKNNNDGNYFESQELKNLSSQNNENQEKFENFQKNPHEISNEKNGNNISNILHYKEINENSKSLITIKDFEGESDFLEKDDYRISNKKNLNFSNDLTNVNSNKITNKSSSLAKKAREKSSVELLREQLMEEFKKIEVLPSLNQTSNNNINNNNINSNSINNNINNGIHNNNNNNNNNNNQSQQVENKEKSIDEQEEMMKFKQEQLKLWSEMMDNLKRLQDSQLNPIIKSQILELERFSEFNLKSLKDDKETVQNGLKPRKSRENIIKNKPVLQINIEEEDMTNNVSDKIKNTPSEDNPSSILGDSMKPNFKGETPPSNDHLMFDPLKSGKTDQGTMVFLKKPASSNMRKRSDENKESEKSDKISNKSKEVNMKSEESLKEIMEKNRENIENGKNPRFFKETPMKNEENQEKPRKYSKETPNKSIEKLDPFEEFAIKHKSEQKKPQNLIEMREKVLEIRQEAEMKHMQQMLASKKVSPKSFEFQKRELEKWVSSERNEINKTKNDIKQSWVRTADAIQKTRRDLAFLKKIRGGQQNDELPDYNMKFSFSQDDLFNRPSFMFKSCESLKKDHEVIRVFDDRGSKDCENKPISREDLFEEYKESEESKRMRSEEESQSQRNIIAYFTGKNNGNYQKKEDFWIKNSDSANESRKNEDLVIKNNDSGKRIRGSPRENNGETLKVTDFLLKNSNSQRNITDNQKNYVQEKESNEIQNIIDAFRENTVKKLENKNIIDSLNKKKEENQDILGFFKEKQQENKEKQQENLDIIESNNAIFLENQIKSSNSPTESQYKKDVFNSENTKEDDHEVIKLDFFMDFNDLENELLKGEDEISDNWRNLNENKQENHQKNIENNANIAFLERNNMICEAVLEELMRDFMGESIVKKQRENMIGLLLKKQHISHCNKEFDSHFPKEDYSLIKSQEFLKTENSRMFSSALSVIKEYLKELKDFLLENCTKPLGRIILDRINTPLGYNPPDKLRFLRKNLYKFSAMLAENVMIPYIDREIPRIPVIPDEAFELVNYQILKKVKSNIYCSDEVREDYFRLLFNSFNESLDFFRPYGIKGQPSFLKCSQNKKFLEITDQNINEIYCKALGRTLEWSETLCGLLPDKDEKTVESSDADMDYIGQLREEKMARMLAQEVIDSEGDWVNYEEQEVEIKLEISQLVWEEFLMQNIDEIVKVVGGK